MSLYKRSISVLKNLQFKNGAILATPLDGAYPYVYPRDAVFVTKAFNKLGLFKKSEKFYHFMNKFARLEKHKEVFHRYTQEGWPCVTRKKESDVAGLVLHGIYDTYEYNKDISFLEVMWPTVQALLKFIDKNTRKGLVHTYNSIHEFYRLEFGYEIWANSACCRGLYDASEIAKAIGNKKDGRRLKLKADFLKKNIIKKLFDKKRNTFIKNIKFKRYVHDISQLAPFYFNLVNNKRILNSTMKILRKNIWNKDIGGFRRFKKFEVCKDWHWYTGGSGSWITLTAWGCRFYRELGQKKYAEECEQWIEEAARLNKGLLPEHIATCEEYELWKENEIEFNRRILSEMNKTEKVVKLCKDGVVGWAVPLAWSHAEYLSLNHEG